MTTGKAIALIIRTFVIKVISLHFSMVYRWFVIAFFPKVQVSFNFMVSTVILEPKKIKSVIVSNS